MGQSAITSVNLGVPAFRQSFTDGDLSSGVLTVTHNLNSQYSVVQVFNNSDLIIIPDDVTATDANTTTIDLTSFGTLTGTWQAVIIDKGATQSQISVATDLNLSGQTQYDRLYYNGTNWVRIPGCLFLAQADGTQTNITPDATTTISFPTETFDIGSNFASNTFTAPVTGYYQLSALIYLQNTDTAATSYNCRIAVAGTSSGSYYGTFSQEGTSDRAEYTTNISVLLHMTASDTATVVVTQNSGAAQTDINAQTRFSGFLVVPA